VAGKVKRVMFVLFFTGEDIPEALGDLYSQMIHSLGDRLLNAYSAGMDVNEQDMEAELGFVDRRIKGKVFLEGCASCRHSEAVTTRGGGILHAGAHMLFWCFEKGKLVLGGQTCKGFKPQ